MIPVGILGASGMVGQRYAQLLKEHPWFRLTFLGASPRSMGTICPQSALPIEPIKAGKDRCLLVFSCIGDPETARLIEEEYAAAGVAVISNTSAHRRHPLVPVIIPEINADHLAVISCQPWKAPIIAKPNCSLQSYLLPLYALHRTHPIKRAIITTLQAISGAGRGADPLEDNLIPHIHNEEQKSEWEPLKILGSVTKAGIQNHAGISLAAHCNRVPVQDGHLACVSVEFDRALDQKEIITAWKDFPGLNLPSAPEQPIQYRPEPDRPQPRLDRDAGLGMAISVGRLRPCPVLGWRFVGLSHNTIRGAAGGGIFNAELLVKSEMWHGNR